MYFLNINKPKGITSFDVVRNLRKRLQIKQIGHSGTLDPLASGVLQVGVGKAAKLLEYLDSDKIYVAKLKFGYITPTYDSEGEKTFIKKPDFSKPELEACLNTFVGKTKQIPPKYSAIKINGEKLCNLARKNKQIDIPSREIEIYYIKLLNFNNYDEAELEVSCKKGTYIRSLAFDIGEKLSCGAFLEGLTRIKAGGFKIENSNNLNDEIYTKINPLDALSLEKYELSDEEYKRIIHGNSILKNKEFKNNNILLTKENKLVSIANLSDNLIRPKKNFEGN